MNFGKFNLIRQIAKGGMAEIWLAEQKGPSGFSKQVVIKKVLPHLAEDQHFIEMFLDEARLVARLDHPNIVQIFELGEIDGMYFIAMEYISGFDVSNIRDRALEFGRIVHPEIAARIISDACQGLDYAHRFKSPDGDHLNLVHRDISPQNILVSREGTAKLVDFGVAKAATSTHQTQTGAVKGKFSYMSPEQISGVPLDGRSDVFSMGIVLFELVTGIRPFGHDNELKAVTAILSSPPPSPRSIRGDLPASMEAIILKALEKDPNNRYQTAHSLSRDLEGFLLSSGVMVTSHEISEYLNDLFSDNPHFKLPWATIAETQAALPSIRAAASNYVSPTSPSTPPQTTPAPKPAPDPTIPKSDVSNINNTNKSKPMSHGVGFGLIFALALIILTLLGGAGFLVYHFFLSDRTDPQSTKISEISETNTDDSKDVQEDKALALLSEVSAETNSVSTTSQQDHETIPTHKSLSITRDINEDNYISSIKPDTQSQNPPPKDAREDKDIRAVNTKLEDIKIKDINANITHNKETTTHKDVVPSKDTRIEETKTKDTTPVDLVSRDTRTARTDVTQQSLPDAPVKPDIYEITVSLPSDVSEKDTLTETEASDELPGVKTDVKKGYGVIAIKTTPPTKVSVNKKKYKTPVELTLKTGKTKFSFSKGKGADKIKKTFTWNITEGRKITKKYTFKKGTLTVVSFPVKGHKVYVDGELVGTTPFKSVSVMEGSHKIKVVTGKTKANHKEKVNIRAGRKSVVRFNW